MPCVQYQRKQRKKKSLKKKNKTKTKFSHRELRTMARSKECKEAETVDGVFPVSVDKIFVISIRPDRWMMFQLRMGSWADQAVRFDGTDGRRISRSNWVKRRLIRRNCSLRRGQLGCYHSHLRLWKKIEAEKLQRTLICEDDAAIYNNPVTADFLKKIQEETKNTDFDILMLGHHCRKNPPRVTAHVEKAPDTVGMFAYIVTLKGVRKMLKAHFRPYKTPIDNFLSSQIQVLGLKVLRTKPAVCFVVPVSSSDTRNIK